MGILYAGRHLVWPPGSGCQLRLQADAPRSAGSHGVALRGSLDQYRGLCVGAPASRTRGGGADPALPPDLGPPDRGQPARRPAGFHRAARLQGRDAEGGESGVSPEISIIIPAFNEAGRLPATLDRVQHFLETSRLSAEVIVVDDGSRDATAEVVRQRAAAWPQLQLVASARNLGKGAAVQLGMAQARGRYRIFSDADLSVPIDDLEKLLRPLRSGAGVAIASRGLKDSQVELH
ncbi:MAG: glycosyltransferase, partial [Chloroflexota bacterium]